MSEQSRHRAYHRNRAIVKKINSEPSAYALDRMTEAELWTLARRKAGELQRGLAGSADVELARAARDLVPTVNELYLRGHQLSIWGDPVRPA